jgi:hypothetical protein
VYLGPEDALTFGGISLGVTPHITATLRRLMPDGEINVSQYEFDLPPTYLTPFTFTIAPAEGWLLSLHINGTAPQRGQCFLKAHTVVNLGMASQALGQLLVQGYLSQEDHLGYPPGVIEPGFSGHGAVIEFIPPLPLPGTEHLIAVQNNTIWRVVALGVAFSTSAAAGNRSPQFYFEAPDGHAVYITPPTASVPPSTLATFFLAPGVDTQVSGEWYQYPIPADFLLTANWKITTVTANRQTTDQWSNMYLEVEQWVT